MSTHLQSLGERKINRLIAEFSIPAIVGMLVMASYNVVDRIFVGRGVGTLAITSIAITFPINIIIMGFGQLVGMGAMALISIKLGEKNTEEAESLLRNAFSLSLIISIMLSLLIYAFMNPILQFLGGSGETLELAREYMNIVIIGIPFQFVLFSLNSIIRSEGKPKTALSTILISGILNIILNPLFIMVFHLGIKGSAVATVISQIIGAAWVISYFRSKRSFLKLGKAEINFERMGKILNLGMSPFIMQITSSVIFFLFNMLLLQYGSNHALAAMSICLSILMMITMPMYGLNHGVQPIIGYNYGARNLARVKETFIKGVFLSTLLCITGFVVIMLFTKEIIELFNSSDAELINLGTHAMKVFLVSLPVVGFQVISWAYFQAVGKPKQAMILTLTKQVLLLIPLLLILPKFYGLEGIFWTGPLADFVGAVITVVLLIVESGRMKKMQASMDAQKAVLPG